MTLRYARCPRHGEALIDGCYLCGLEIELKKQSLAIEERKVIALEEIKETIDKI